MWKRNLLFVVVCLVGAGSLTGSLMRRDRIAPPEGFQSHATPPEWQPVVDQLNREFEGHWQDQGLEPAKRADDLIVLRRLSLGLTGTLPSLEEIRAVEAVPGQDRVAWWLARLLQDRRYSDYVAERFLRAYVGAENGPFIFFRRRRFATWLSDELLANTPYDQIVNKLLSGSGIWTDNPAVNFVTVTLDQNKDNQPDPIRLAGRTSRAFLGMRIDCLQCHDDQLGNIRLGTTDSPRPGTQQDFHQLAAFFGNTQRSLLGITDRNRDPYRYKYLHEETDAVVPPRVPFADEFFGTSSGTQREQLARWVTNPRNKPFARTIVNRVWALLFGRPLVDPIDDIPLHGEFPPGMETLADDFVTHGYDLQRLIRIIAATRVFQLDSRSLEFDVTPEHDANWAVFPLTRLRPEQVAGAIIQSASLKTIDAQSHILFKLQRYAQENDFVRSYGDMGDDEFEDRGGTVTQRLLMMNGELTKERTQENVVLNAATRIAKLAPTDEKAVEIAYLITLSRRPTESESTTFVSRLRKLENSDREEALEDLCWILLNCTEFSWNH